MTRLVIPAGRVATVITVSALLHEFLESNRYAWVREIFGLRRDVPYVANLIADSILPVRPGDFWQSRSLPEFRGKLFNLLDSPPSAWEIKSQADQLLLLLGSSRPSKLRWGKLPDEDVEELKKIGSSFYGIAAELAPQADREDMESMSLDFSPWTEILIELERSRKVIPA